MHLNSSLCVFVDEYQLNVDTVSVPADEKTGPPMDVWRVASASSSPCLCADTPEFS